MFDAIGRLPPRRMIFAVLVLIVFGTSAVEIIQEFAAGETLANMTDDLLRFFLSAAVIGMLKGLSFREIAQLRDTREKTMRQQASSVYRKAGVSSRNQLAAWFFEDMLEPPPVEQTR